MVHIMTTRCDDSSRNTRWMFLIMSFRSCTCAGGSVVRILFKAISRLNSLNNTSLARWRGSTTTGRLIQNGVSRERERARDMGPRENHAASLLCEGLRKMRESARELRVKSYSSINGNLMIVMNKINMKRLAGPLSFALSESLSLSFSCALCLFLS